jgi:hypothetical protein
MSDKGDLEWTERSGALERRLLRVDKYLASDAGNVSGEPEQLKLVDDSTAENSPAKKGR